MNCLPSAIDIWFIHLGLKLSDIKKSFQVFGFDIYFYGCVIAVSVLVGLLIACHVAKKTGQNPEQYMELVVYAIIFGIIGARLYYVVFAWKDYKDNLAEIFNLRAGGLAIYGGVIAGAATAILYSRKKKLSPRLVLDTACCGLIAGQCTGRWSNFINMEAFGRYTDGPLAMRLNLAKVNPSMVSAEHMEHLIELDGVRYIQVHPTFLYESLWSLGVLLLLLFMTKRKKFDGQIFLLYLIGYGTGRFWIEGLRTDQLQIGSTGIAVSQLLSAVLVIAAVILTVVGLRRQKLMAAAAEVLAGELQKAVETARQPQEKIPEAPEEAPEAVREAAEEAEKAPSEDLPED